MSSDATVQRACDGVASLVRAAERRGERCVRVDVTRLAPDALARVAGRFRGDGYVVTTVWSAPATTVVTLRW